MQRRFFALFFPEAQVACLRAPLRHLSTAALVPVTRPHLTLRWIGAGILRRSTLQRIETLVETLPSPRWTAFALQPFPETRPLLLAARLVGDATGLTLVRQLDELLLADGVPKRDQPFVPHVTLRRARDCTTVAPLRCSLTADRLSLVQSTLTPVGPRYSVEHVFPFHA